MSAEIKYKPKSKHNFGSHKGIVTVTKRNVDTGEEESFTVENNATVSIMKMIYTRYAFREPSLYNNYGYTQIGISQQKMIKNSALIRLGWHHGVTTNVRDPDLLSNPNATLVYPNQSYRYAQLNEYDDLGAHISTTFEMKRRWSVPSSRREINTIFVGPGSNTNRNIQSTDMIAYVPLAEPCYQETNQEIDITYRIIVLLNQEDPQYSSKFGAEALWRTWWFYQNTLRGDTLGHSITTRQYPVGHYNFFAPFDQLTGDLAGGEAGTAGSRTTHWNTNAVGYNYTSYKRYGAKGHYSRQYGPTTNVGQLFGSWVVKGYSTAVSTELAPVTSDDDTVFSNKPIQVIHNHTKNSNFPFQNVDFLASGTGKPLVDGSQWQDAEWAKFMRIEYTGKRSGRIDDTTQETSYFFRDRRITGFDSNNYNNRAVNATFLKTPRRDGQSGGFNTYGSIKGLHRGRHHYFFPNSYGNNTEQPRMEEFSPTAWITWGPSGLVIHDQTNGDYMVFDDENQFIPNTYEELRNHVQLVVTDIRQCCKPVGEDVVWVADGGQGLYKIENPMGVANITRQTNALHGVPDVGCFGVAEGYDGRIWAVFDGDIMYLDRGQTQWQMPANNVVIAGITDDNKWNNIQYIRADMTCPQHHVGIVFYSVNDPTFYEFRFYIPHIGITADAEWQGTIGQTINAGNLRMAQSYGALWCTHEGGMWLCNRINDKRYITSSQENSRTSQVLLSVYGDGVVYTLQRGGRNWKQNVSQPCNYYDYYGNPLSIGVQHHWFESRENNNYLPNGWSVSQMHGWKYVLTDNSQSTNDGAYQYRSLLMAFNKHDRNNSMLMYVGRVYNASKIKDGDIRMQAGLSGRGSFWKDTYSDHLNTRHSGLSEQIWQTYKWNPTVSDWDPKYYHHAPDLTGNNNHGIRHNFEPEDHAFYGRQMIDFSSSFSTNTISNDKLTIAVNFTSRLKLNRYNSTAYNRADIQEYNQVLFSLSDVHLYTDQAGGEGHVLTILNRHSQDQGRFAVQAKRPDFTFQQGTTHETVTTFLNASLPEDTAAIQDRELHRAVVVIDGLQLYFYVDGVLLLPDNAAPGQTFTYTLPYKPDLSNPSGNLIAHLGCETHHVHFSLTTPFQTDFYRGEMANFQVYNSAWTQADVDNDLITNGPTNFNNDVITPSDGGALVTRFALGRDNTDLFGTETKLLHTDQQHLKDGITAGFEDGAAGNSFVLGDFHTFGVTNGVLHDNVTTWRSAFGMYKLPTDINFSDVTNGSGGLTVPTTATTLVGRPNWCNVRGSVTWTRDSVAFNSDPGGASSNLDWGLTTCESITGDGYIEMRSSSKNIYGYFGFTSTPQGAVFLSSVDQAAYFTDLPSNAYVQNQDNTITAYRGNGVLNGHVNEGIIQENGSNIIYEPGDLFRMDRTSGTVTLQKYDPDTQTFNVLHTYSGTSTGTIYGRICAVDGAKGGGFSDIRIKYQLPPYHMKIGIPENGSIEGTGSYSDSFYVVDSLGRSLSSAYVDLDGTRLTVIPTVTENTSTAYVDGYVGNMPEPSANQVTLNEGCGILRFHQNTVTPADDHGGRTVTGASFNVTYREI